MEAGISFLHTSVTNTGVGSAGADGQLRVVLFTRNGPPLESEAFGSSMAGDVIAEALILKSGSFEISVIGGRVNLHPLIIPGQIRAIC